MNDVEIEFNREIWDTDNDTGILTLEEVETTNKNRKFVSNRLKRRDDKVKSDIVTINIYNGDTELLIQQDNDVIIDNLPPVKTYEVGFNSNSGSETETGPITTTIILSAPEGHVKELLSASSEAEAFTLSVEEVEKINPELPVGAPVFDANNELKAIVTEKGTVLTFSKLEDENQFNRGSIWYLSWKAASSVSPNLSMNYLVDNIAEQATNAEVVSGKIKRRTKGGFVVDIDGIEAIVIGDDPDIKEGGVYKFNVQKPRRRTEMIVLNFDHKPGN